MTIPTHAYPFLILLAMLEKGLSLFFVSVSWLFGTTTEIVDLYDVSYTSGDFVCQDWGSVFVSINLQSTNFHSRDLDAGYSNVHT
jgi:hypothetical protein